MQKLVSIITPCYNGEKYVHRFLDSILAQTYRTIELIFINDGSTDRSGDVVKGYIPVFRKKGMSLVYREQGNAGQAAALNEGLKLFTGEYLAWMDADDYLDITSIEKRVVFLENHPQYGFVRTNAYYVDAETLKPIKRVAVLPRRFNSRLFKGLIEGSQFVLNGCYMVRTGVFEDVNPDRIIESSWIGQNFQMLLPLAYKYSCGFIDEPLFYYVNTPGSHSRVKRNYEEALVRCKELYRLLYSICERINMLPADRKKYNKIINRDMLWRCRNLALEYRCFKDFCEYQTQYSSLYPVVFRGLLPLKQKYHFLQLYRQLVPALKTMIKYFMK